MKPLALDLFCCGGGSAVGLERAGFDVIGVDWKPSKFWSGAGELHEVDLSTADAVEAVVRAFKPDFVSASPPCQANSVATGVRHRALHRNLIASTREGLTRAGVPAWMENVPPVPAAKWPEIVRPDVVLCGSMFQQTQRLRRHRHFELLGWFVFTPAHVNCTFAPISLHDGSTGTNQRAAIARRETITVCENAAGGRGMHRGSKWHEKGKQLAQRRAITIVSGDNGSRGAGRTWQQNAHGVDGINWRTALGWLDGPTDRYSLAQCVPPAYAEWLGRAFLTNAATAAGRNP